MRREIDAIEHKTLTLALLKAFAEVCENNNLRYILDFGTLLGAIRHNGFIPWDDDIDVSMPRKDYEQLIELYNSNQVFFGQHYKLASVKTDYNVYKPYLNLVDVRTRTISKVRKEKYWYPIWIDIFPMDSVLDDEVKTENKRKRVYKYRDLIGMGITDVSESASIIRKVYFKILELSERIWLTKIDHICASHNNNDRITTYYYSDKSNCDISLYNKYTYHVFENDLYRIPVDYDEKLKRLYGDYMTPPDEAERINHTTGSFWLS